MCARDMQLLLLMPSFSSVSSSGIHECLGLHTLVTFGYLEIVAIGCGLCLNSTQEGGFQFLDAFVFMGGGAVVCRTQGK